MEAFASTLKFLAIIFLSACLTNSSLAQIKVSGIVTDDHLHPLSEASIYIQGSINGTSADSAGHFLFHVPRGEQTIIVSSVGFKDAKKHFRLMIQPWK